jgi:thiamine-phosphate pyrophosphorylase
LLKSGIEWLQLRVKAMPPRNFLDLACAARRRTRSSSCKLIVNDRVDIALACAADGVHLGQEDLPLQAARKLMGDRIIGISTHDVEQAKAAEASGADYIGFGPMFGTATKATGYSARGLEMLRRVREAVRIPIVAIGGITEGNVNEVWHAGADSAAIISDLLGSDDIADKIKRILALRQAV